MFAPKDYIIFSCNKIINTYGLLQKIALNQLFLEFHWYHSSASTYRFTVIGLRGSLRYSQLSDNFCINEEFVSIKVK